MISTLRAPAASHAIPSLPITCLLAVSVLLTTMWIPAASAQWSSDPALNFAIADLGGEQVIPKIASTSGGGCYVGWFDQSSGNYDVRLQLFDEAGVEQWPHNGIVVSAHPQNSWLVDWDLIADDTSAVLVFADARAGADFDIYAYRVDASGAMLWGPDGIALSANADFEPAPRVAHATDGNFVFVWSRLPDAAGGSIMMQRVTPAGVELLAPGGVPVVTSATESPAFVEVANLFDCPGDAGSSGDRHLPGDVMITWVRDITTFMSPRHIRAQRIDAGGNAVWPVPLEVFNATSVPIAHTPKLQSTCGRSAYVLWHWSDGNRFHSTVQLVGEDGDIGFPHNGLDVSTTANRHQLNPTLAIGWPDPDVFVFWLEENLNQTQWGVYGQKITVNGGREWGDAGIEYVPVNDIFKLSLISMPFSGGAMVYWIDEPTGQFDQNSVTGLRVIDDGGVWWTADVATTLSGKSKLAVAPGAWQQGAVLVWEDDRQGTVDVYGQNVNPDGSFGQPTTSIGGGGAPAMTFELRARPNPFRHSTEILIDTGSGTGGGWSRDGRVEVFDAAGRLVTRLPIRAPSAGRYRLAWDGRDGRGTAVPAGVYFYRLVSAEGRSPVGKATLVR